MTHEMDFVLYVVIEGLFYAMALEVIWQPTTSYWQDALIQWGHWSLRPILILAYILTWC